MFLYSIKSKLSSSQWQRYLHGIIAMALSGWVIASDLLDKPLTLMRERYSAESYTTFYVLKNLIYELRQAKEEDKVWAINQFVNQNILFVNDIDLWDKPDYWATPVETFGKLAGDCEDFSIAKYVWLKLLNVPQDKLRLTYVRAHMQDGFIRAHMVLAYYNTPESEPLILDNINHQLLPASKRGDLTPVFSFNDKGLFIASRPQYKIGSATNISKWRDVLSRMQEDGLE